MDGFVYGALCGLGFAVVEDVVYFMAAFGGTPQGVLQGFYVRVLSSGLYGHVLYTGLVGMAIGIVVSRREPAPLRDRLWTAAGIVVLRRVSGTSCGTRPLLSITPSAPIEGGEWLLVTLGMAVKGLPLLLFVVTRASPRPPTRGRWLDDALAAEIGGEGIWPEEYRDLRDPRRRRAAVAATRRRAGARRGAPPRRGSSTSRSTSRCSRSRVATRRRPGARGATGLLPVASDWRSRRSRARCRPPAPRRPKAAARLRGWRETDLIAGVLAREPRAVARAISLVEDGDDTLASLSAGIYEHTGSAATIGLTGAPGVGKSTLADDAGRAWRGATAAGSRCSRSIRPRRTRAARCSAIGCGCRSTRRTRTCSSVRWRPGDTSAGWRWRPPRRSGSSTRPATTW